MNDTPVSVRSYLKAFDDLRGQGVELVVKKGELLIEAKEDLQHGEWQELCRGLPFSERHAHRLRRIAAHPVLSNRTLMSDLPDDLVALYVLSGVDELLVEAMIRDGRIHSRLTIDDARLLTGSVRETGQRPLWDVDKAIKQIRRVARGAPAADRSELAMHLRMLADQLDKNSTTASSNSRRGRPDPGVVRDVITAGLRAVTVKHHPDHGGDPETMKAINLAVEWLRAQARTLVRH